MSDQEIRQELVQLQTQVEDMQQALASLHRHIAACLNRMGLPQPDDRPAVEPPAVVADTQPDPEPESSMPSAGDASADGLSQGELIAACEALHADLTDGSIGMDPTDCNFLGKVRPVLVDAGEARQQRLLDIVGFIDRLGASYVGQAYADLHGRLGDIRRLIDQALRPDAYLLQTTQADPNCPGPSLPVNQALILASGVGGVHSKAAQCLKPISDAAPALSLSWALVEELYALLRQHYKAGLKKDLTAALPRLSGITGDDETAWTEARGVLNMHTRWGERADTPAVKNMITQLKQRFGWSAFQLDRGTRFNPEQHDAKRYDRVARSDSAEPGSVVGLRQIGLLGADGMPVQQCVVVISQ
jgi:hypothetical protein